MSTGTPIDNMRAMSPQARAALKRRGLKTLEEVAELTDQELLGIKGFKTASLDKLRAWQIVHSHDPAAVPGVFSAHRDLGLAAAGNVFDNLRTWREDKEDARAWELYLLFSKEKGYSPEHAKNAVKGVRELGQAMAAPRGES